MNSPKRANIFALFLVIFSLPASAAISFVILKAKIDIEKAMLVFVVIQDLILILIPVLLYCLVTKTRLSDTVCHERLSLKNIAYIVLLTILISPLISLVSSITTMFYPAEINADMYKYINDLSFPFAMIALGVMPAVFEELVFRGVILNNYKSTGFLVSSVVSSLFFGLYHQDFYQMGYAVAAGLFFSFIVANTNSIYASIFSHFLINGTQVAASKISLIFMDEREIAQLLESTQETNTDLSLIFYPIFYTVIFLPFFVMTAKKFVKYNKDNRLNYELSISSKQTKAFEISIDNDMKKNKTRFVDIYFVLYVMLCIGLTILYSMSK